MSQFCQYCKVELENTVSHCPLCGKCINEQVEGKKNLHEHFPSDEAFKMGKQKALKSIALLLLIGNAIYLFIELLLYKKISLSLHFLVASFFAYFGIIRPIHQNWRLVNYHSIFYIMFTGYIIFLENYTNSFGWGLIYVIPLFALTFSINNFTMILSNIKNRFDYILPMLILLTISTTTFVICYVGKFTLWPSLAAFLTAITFTIISFVFHSTKILKALAKKFHI